MWEGISSCGKVDSFVWTERHKEKVCGELHEGKQVDESEWCLFSTKQFLSIENFMQWVQYFPMDGADEASVEDLGWERKGPVMTEGSAASFSTQQNRIWSTVVTISVNCDAKKK